MRVKTNSYLTESPETGEERHSTANQRCKMAEQFLTLMADFDDDSQTIMSAWYNSLIQAGFSGTQTTNLPFHISMASFQLEKEQEAAELTKK